MPDRVATLRSVPTALQALRHTRRMAVRWDERRSGCPVCGGRVAAAPPRPILPEALVREWELGPHLQRLYDEREGTACAACGATGRSRALALAFLVATRQPEGVGFAAAARDWKGGAIAEINQAKELHAWLEHVPDLRYSEYGSTQAGTPSEDLEQLSYADASIRYLFCSDTLEHVPSFERALAELWRVLEPGGAALITVPLLWHRPTRVRARRSHGEVRHLLPPSYHGSQALARPSDGHFVYRELGYDVLDVFRERFATRVVFLDLWSNPFQCAFVLERRSSA